MRTASPALTSTTHLVTFSEIFNYTASPTNPNTLAMASIAITAGRARLYGTFSLPYFQSGLDVLTRTKDSRANLFLFFAPFSVWLWLSIIVCLYFSGHVIWFLERSYQPVSFPRPYLKGVNEGTWYCWGILTGTCAKDLIGFPARMYSVGWSILSVVFVAAYTANLATILTVEQLRSDISGYQQLGGKFVGAVRGAAGEAFVLQNVPNALLVPFNTAEDCVDALLNARIDAMVHDAASLVYLKASRDQSNKLKLLGASLTADEFAVLMADAFTLGKELGDALLLMKDDESLDTIYRKWFTYQTTTTSSALISNDPKALTLQSVSGMYITLAVSLAVAILTFIFFKFKKCF